MKSAVHKDLSIVCSGTHLLSIVHKRGLGAHRIAMHFPFLLDPQRSAVQAKPKLSAKTADEEVREQAAKAVGADERQRQALMRSFATVRTQFEDLDGQSNPRVRSAKRYCC
jgi:hypothetical protein